MHCSSYEKLELHVVLHLIVSTVRELRVRIRELDNSNDQRYLLILFIELYRQIRIHSLFSDIFEPVGLHQRVTVWLSRHSSINTRSYDSDTKILAMCFQRLLWLTTNSTYIRWTCSWYTARKTQHFIAFRIDFCSMKLTETIINSWKCKFLWGCVTYIYMGNIGFSLAGWSASNCIKMEANTLI